MTRPCLQLTLLIELIGGQIGEQQVNAKSGFLLVERCCMLKSDSIHLHMSIPD